MLELKKKLNKLYIDRYVNIDYRSGKLKGCKQNDSCQLSASLTWVVSMHHILVVRLLTPFRVRCVGNNISKIDVHTRPTALFMRNSMMPVLLRASQHNKQVTIAELKLFLGDFVINSIALSGTRPAIGHPPKLKTGPTTKRQAGNSRGWTQESPAVGVPSDFVFTIKV